MSKSIYFQLDARQTRRNAMVDALRAPCYALCITMAGFSTIARESGFDFMMTLITSLGVWGMPGQVAFASLYSAGATLVVIFVAVSLANMRMLLMVISAADMMHLKSHHLPVWKRVFWMQFLAITAWAHLGFAQQKYPSHLLLPYYQGFSLTIFTFGILGTVMGFFLTDILPPELLRVVIFVTPIYILLLIINARQKANRLAVVFGGALSPLFFPFAGEWAILLAGLIGGTLASLYGRFIAKWHLELEA
ncbi:MAG: AzlC family ABC transporter permease [Candidatus Puniceispirillaceae bacterium]